MSLGAPGSPPTASPPGPQAVTNPPNRATIAYRVGDFAAFRQALLEARPGETALAGWRPATGDLGLQVLEWWAYLADVLTFYNERIANESYLGTAELPGSISGLVALLGYRPRPGIAATGMLAALRSTRNQLEPLVIPAGTQFANQATPGVPVQTYEALGTRTFTAPVSDTTVTPPADDALPHVDPDTGAASVLLAGKVSGIAAGDALLLMRDDWVGTDQNWAQVTVGGATPESDAGGVSNTRVTFSAITWGVQQPPPGPTLIFEVGDFPAESEALAGLAREEDVYRVDPLRADPAPDAPEPDPTVDHYRLLKPRQTAALWSANASTTTGFYDQGDFAVRLSAVVRAFAPGDPVLFSDAARGGAVMATVAGISEEMLTVEYPGAPPPTPPTIPVAHTVLALTVPSVTDADALADLSPTSTAVRYGFRDVGTIIPSPATSLPPLPVTMTPAAPLPPLKDAPAFLEDATGAGAPVSVSTNSGGTVTVAAPAAPAATPVTLALALPVRLLIDLVPISQGATVAAESLGVGSAALANQTFALRKSPLTYLPHGNGFASTLQITVDGISWTEVGSFYGQAPGALVFTVTQAGDGTSVVRFGDGIQGARLPTGSQVVARYRYGAGAATPPAGRLTTVLRPQTNLAAVHNPVIVAGGEDPEPPSSMRAAAPASVLTFGRAISADDYATVAAQAAGVDRARAYWTWDAAAQRTTIKVYVDGDAGAQAAASAALAGSDDPNRPVSVVAVSATALTVSAGLAIAPDATADADGVVAAAQAALAGLLRPDRMAIGEVLFASRIEAALMVSGVTAVHNLSVTVPETIRFPRLGFLARRLGIVDREPAVDLFGGAAGSADPGEGGVYTLAETPDLWPEASGG